MIWMGKNKELILADIYAFIAPRLNKYVMIVLSPARSDPY